MDLNNNQTFQLVFLGCTFVAVSIALVAIYVLRKKGINIYKKHRILKISLCSLPIILLPVIAHPALTSAGKAKAAISGISIAILTYFIVDRGGKKFRKSVGYETKWDKEEREFEELERQGSKENHLK